MSWRLGPNEVRIRDAAEVFQGMRVPVLMPKSHAVRAGFLAEHSDLRCAWRQALA